MGPTLFGSTNIVAAPAHIYPEHTSNQEVSVSSASSYLPEIFQILLQVEAQIDPGCDARAIDFAEKQQRMSQCRYAKRASQDNCNKSGLRQGFEQIGKYRSNQVDTGCFTDIYGDSYGAEKFGLLTVSKDSRITAIVPQMSLDCKKLIIQLAGFPQSR